MPKKVEAWMAPGPNGPSLYLSKGEALKHEFLHYLQGSFGNPEEMNPSVEDVLQFAREVLEEIEGKAEKKAGKIWKPFCKEDLKVGRYYLFLSQWWLEQYKTPMIGYLDKNDQLHDLPGSVVVSGIDITHYTSFEDGLPKPGEEAEEVLLPWVPAENWPTERIGLGHWPGDTTRSLVYRNESGSWISPAWTGRPRHTDAPSHLLDIDQIPFPEDKKQ